MWHCEWQQFLFKPGNFQNLAKSTCYANYFIIVLRAKRKEQNSRQKKPSHSAGQGASWPMPGMDKEHSCIRQQPDEDTEPLCLPLTCSTQNPVTITTDIAQGYVRWRNSVRWWWTPWAGQLGGDASTSLLLPTAPLPSQLLGSRSTQAQRSASLTPAWALLCVFHCGRRRGAHSPGFSVCCWEAVSSEQALIKPKWLWKHLRSTTAMPTRS